MEYLASILRFSSYYFIFISFYLVTSQNLINIENFKPVISFIVLFCFVISIIQISSGNMPFMNGAHRLSSIYGQTPAGFALLMLFCSIFYFSVYFFEDSIKDKKRVLFLAILSALMMYATQSRQALATLIIFLFIVLLMNSSWILKVIYSFFIVIVLWCIYWLLLNTSIFPRITDMLTRDDTDSSTQTRKNIIDITINNLEGLDKYIGVGLGGFNQFYFKNTGELGVAAHNDFLLFYIEGGFVAFISYIFFLTFATVFWFKAYKKYGKKFLVPLSIFVAIYICSFLNNPFYYPQIQVLVSATLGIYLSYYIKYKKSLFNH
ncbi:MULTISPECIES: O-antigen ligase family protein [unclassified Providencia]|uniref:O-antigen ligase family protein n=1 Tax=unclassified Providencia TaxID=2633465 RepID=UPI00234997CB|nr:MULTISPECIES: O-antigen ligase family protein [unclassified Providencia]